MPVTASKRSISVVHARCTSGQLYTGCVAFHAAYMHKQRARVFVSLVLRGLEENPAASWVFMATAMNPHQPVLQLQWSEYIRIRTNYSKIRNR